YYSADGGDAAAPPYRPLQPRKVLAVDNTAAGPVHGILWTSGGFTDTTGFNPVIARPSVEWEKDPTEPQVCYTGFWPSELFRVNTLDNAVGALQQTIVVTPGQFRCDSPAGAEVKGTQRLFQSLGWETLRSANSDVTAPSLSDLDIGPSSNPALPVALQISTVDPVVGAVQPSGISRIVVLRISPAGGSGSVTTIADQSFTPVPSGTFSINIASPANDRLIIQIVDAAGNVGVYTAKGPGLRILNVELGPDREYGVAPVIFTANVNPAGESLVEPVSSFWDFGDGSTATTNTSTTSHTFPPAQPQYTVKVRVSDANGGIGFDRVLVSNYCWDPLGDAGFSGDATISAAQADFVGCSVSNDTSKLTITLRTAAPLTNGTATTFPARIRYTVSVAVGNGPSKNLSYREGSATGLKSLVVTLSGDTISFTFDQKDVGWSPGKQLTWFAETQGGVPGAPGAGTLDRMKDSGTFSYGP
ncbi:MAG: PKD domain-containing protein, partial [Tepidiformaceae bacterium]